MGARRRFLAKVEERDGCWLWMASKNGQGHGWFRVATRYYPTNARRAAWLLWRGDVPPSVVIIPCQTPGCVSPWCSTERDAMEHMLATTRAANAASRGRPGRRQKLSDAEARRILRMTRGGWLAARFGVSTAMVHHIASGRAWWWATGLKRRPMVKA